MQVLIGKSPRDDVNGTMHSKEFMWVNLFDKMNKWPKGPKPIMHANEKDKGWLMRICLVSSLVHLFSIEIPSKMR